MECMSNENMPQVLRQYDGWDVEEEKVLVFVMALGEFSRSEIT